eukprot:CAMPEP_0117475200 /NCGR_PEP_ID=MMETSP0784-20121206/9672_1 /TAXON_ID=39447 /ORGANISM="" /LENGTH=97 /DNA_ID=CAMNT_0005269439 /DNA_START=51 /DNA_END=341 /DNA_ORIENTATION=-
MLPRPVPELRTRLRRQLPNKKIPQLQLEEWAVFAHGPDKNSIGTRRMGRLRAATRSMERVPAETPSALADREAPAIADRRLGRVRAGPRNGSGGGGG